MSRRILKDTLVRAAILFGVSVVLVLGFWFHAEFYQLGLLPLVLVGGLAVLAVLVILRFALSSRPPLSWRETGHLEFDRREAASILDGSQTAVLRKAQDDPQFAINSTFSARRSEDGVRFSRLRVVDVRRVLLDDLREEDARSAGCESLSALRRRWEAHESDPDTFVVLLRFAAVGAGP